MTTALRYRNSFFVSANNTAKVSYETKIFLDQTEVSTQDEQFTAKKTIVTFRKLALFPLKTYISCSELNGEKKTKNHNLDLQPATNSLKKKSRVLCESIYRVTPVFTVNVMKSSVDVSNETKGYYMDDFEYDMLLSPR